MDKSDTPLTNKFGMLPMPDALVSLPEKQSLALSQLCKSWEVHSEGLERLLNAARAELAERKPQQEWYPIETYQDEWPICIRAPELIDEFNETGETDACALSGETWQAAQWCNCQDYFKTIEVNPTHWRLK